MARTSAGGRMPLPALAALLAVGAGIVAWAEYDSWRASHEEYPARPVPGPSGRDVVLVLGYPPRRDGSPSFLQRWRTRIALRSSDPAAALFVFSGAAVHGEIPEAVVMAAYGERRGIPPENIVRETQARTTRENIAYALPHLREARTIRIASNTHHARRARGYLREQAPELVERLVPTHDFVPLELGPLRIVLSVYDRVAGRVAARCDAGP
jgi:uncharacterized SAM-binding protein YcdF (DUF218 family)